MSQTLISRRRPEAARQPKTSVRAERTPAPRVQAMLREIAWVLHLTRTVKQNIEREHTRIEK
jgi:hypothetical protein